MVVAIITTAVFICALTGGRRQELHPAQRQLTNNVNKTVINQIFFKLLKLMLHVYKTSAPHIQAPERRRKKVANSDNLFFLSLANSGMPHSSLSVSAPHLYYTCPEGATVKLVCSQAGAPLHKTDVLSKVWLFTPHSDQHCMRQHPRHMNAGHHHGNHSGPPAPNYGASEHNFWVVLQNVTRADQGRYCCMVLDRVNGHSVAQAPHSHVVLTVTPRKDTAFM